MPSYYAEQAIAMIASNFDVPEASQRDATCEVRFRILDDGGILSPEVVRSSGDAALDRLAIEALERTERLLPLPDGLRRRYIDARLVFRFRLGDKLG